MRVLFVSNTLGKGGKERQLYFLLKYLDQEGIKTGLLLRKNEISFDLSNFNNLSIYFCRRPGYLNFLKTYFQVILNFNPQVIHTWEGMVTTYGLLLNIFFNKKFINGEIRYSRPAKRFSLERLQQIINTNFADINIANSHAGLIGFHLVRGNKNLVIPNGYDVTTTHLAKNITTALLSQVIICMVANFTKPKDYISLITVCTELLSKSYNIQMKFIGSGPEFDFVLTQVPIRFKENFLFLGNRDDIFEQLYDSDICVLLSKKGSSEGMSNAIMEYMIAGKPIIATNTGGNPELIINEHNGFLIMHEDKFALSFYLRKLIEEKGLRKLMGDRSRKIAEANFSIKKMAEAYMDVYKNLIAG